VTVGRDRERPRIETIDHFRGRVSERDNCAPSGRVVGIEVDPFVGFRHRDPQINQERRIIASRSCTNSVIQRSPSRRRISAQTLAESMSRIF
jgi:hypothetical protein